MTSSKKKRRGTKGEDKADTQPSVLPDAFDALPPVTEIQEPEAEAPAEPGEWDAAAVDIEAAIIPPPPLGSCGCGDSLRIEMLDSDGQPTGRHRTMGYKLAVAQVSAKRARYARE